MLLIVLCFIVLALIILLQILPYRWMPKEFYDHINKIPGPKGYPIIGNALTIVKLSNEEVYHFMTKMSKELGPIMKIYALGWAHVAFSDPDSVEMVLTNSQNITKAFDYSFLKHWLREGLLLSTGNKWRSRRKLLTPAFHFKILEEYVPVFTRNSNILVRKIWDHINEPFIKVNPLITLCTLDIICETAMGTSIHAQDGKEKEYVKAVQRITELFQLRQLNVLLYKDLVFQLSSYGREQVQVLQTLHGFTRKVIQQRRQEYISNKENNHNQLQAKKRNLAFLDLLIEISETQQKLSNEDIQEEVDTFMFEGHDTTSAAINWALHLLATHPDVQEKVVAELRTIFGDSDRDPTYEDLNQMKYLEQVIKETLRLYPSVPVISRQVEKEFKIREYTIPAGVNATLLIAVLHRNPEVYPDPEKFDPERFSPEASQNRHPFAYVPFSASLRSCIGQKFAMLEEKVVLSTVLRSFRLESIDRPEDVNILMEIILRPKESFRIRFIPRK